MTSPSTGWQYPLKMVCEVYRLARSSFCSQRGSGPSLNRSCGGKRGPRTRWTDSEILVGIRQVLSASSSHSEGHRKIRVKHMNTALRWRLARRSDLMSVSPPSPTTVILVRHLSSRVSNYCGELEGLSLRDKILRLVELQDVVKKLGVALGVEAGMSKASARDRIRSYLQMHRLVVIEGNELAAGLPGIVWLISLGEHGCTRV